jgi:hypothetical protein
MLIFMTIFVARLDCLNIRLCFSRPFVSGALSVLRSSRLAVSSLPLFNIHCTPCSIESFKTIFGVFSFEVRQLAVPALKC